MKTLDGIFVQHPVAYANRRLVRENWTCWYRGWTVVLVRDQYDDDWTAFAKKGEYKTLDQFRTASVPLHEQVLGTTTTSFATRELAYEAAVAAIDVGITMSAETARDLEVLYRDRQP